MSRKKYAILAAPAAVLIAACSSPAATTTPPPSQSAPAAPVAATSAASAPAATSSAPAAGALSGTWNGQYGGAYTGTFVVHWRQNSTKLTGTITLSNPDGGTMPINGTVQGGQISFGTVGSMVITYSGSVAGNSMSGNYQVHAQSGTQNGNWSASKA